MPLPALSDTLVPPTPVTQGEEAGKLTALSRNGAPIRLRGFTQAVDPASPADETPVTPSAAATSSVRLNASAPARPTDRVASRPGSQMPSEAEITSGRLFGRRSGAIRARSTTDPVGRLW